MKPAEYNECPETFTKFAETMRRLLAVPHDVIVQREAEYKRQAEANPNRRGPKKKPKPSA